MSDINLDDLLDKTLDDLADLPEFKPFTPGAHRVRINFEKKIVNNHPSVEMSMELLETLELADPSTEEGASKPGDKTSVLFMLDNEMGQGKLKEVLKPISAALGLGKISEVIEAAKDLEVVVSTKVRVNKDKPDAKYTDIVSLQVA